jgi:hypothetical protein
LLLRPLLANLQHLCIDIKNSDVPWHLLLLLLLLLLNSLRPAWVRMHLLRLLLGCAYGSQNSTGYVPSPACHIQVLHALERTQGVHQAASTRKGAPWHSSALGSVAA